MYYESNEAQEARYVEDAASWAVFANVSTTRWDDGDNQAVVVHITHPGVGGTPPILLGVDSARRMAADLLNAAETWERLNAGTPDAVRP